MVELRGAVLDAARTETGYERKKEKETLGNKGYDKQDERKKRIKM